MLYSFAQQTATFALTVFLTLTALTVHGQNRNTNHSKKDLVTKRTANILIYKIGIPPHDSSDVVPEVVISINTANDKPTFLQFTSGGTETDICVTDSSLVDNYINISDVPSLKFRFGMMETGLFDISDLWEGTFYVSYSSCNFSGSYRMYLTK